MFSWDDEFDTSRCEMYFHFIKLENHSDLLRGSFFLFYFIEIINLNLINFGYLWFFSVFIFLYFYGFFPSILVILSKFIYFSIFNLYLSKFFLHKKK